MNGSIHGRGSSALWYALLRVRPSRICTYHTRKISVCRPQCAKPASAAPNESPKATTDYLAFINSEHIQNLKDIVYDQSLIQDISAMLRTSDCKPEALIELWRKVSAPNSGSSQSVRRRILHFLSSHPSIDTSARPQFIQQFVEAVPYKFRGSNDHAYYIWALCHMNREKEALNVWYSYTHVTRNPTILKSGAFHALMLKLIERSDWEAGLYLWRDAVDVYSEKVVRSRLGHEAKSLLRSLLSCVPDIHTWSLEFVEGFVLPAPMERQNYARWVASESLQLLCHAGRLTDAHELLKACESRKWVLRIGAYNKLITSYLRSNSLEEALQLEQTMKKLPITYNIVTYNLLIRLHGMIGDLPKVQSTFDDIYTCNLVPNEWTYVAIMMSFAKTGQVKVVEQLFDQFLNLGYKPDVTIFGVLIFARAKILDVSGSRKWLAELDTHGLKPTILMYGILSKFFTDSGDVEGAFTCFRAIYQAGLKPTPTIYNALMALSADRGDAEAAVQIFHMMTDEGWANVGETRCLVTLMDAYGSSQNIAKVVDIFNYIKSVETSKPSLVVWTVLMKAYFVAKDGLRARRTFHEALLQGIKPDVAMYTLLMEIENQLAGPERAAEIFHQCLGAGIRPDCRLYTTLMDIYHSAGHYTDVLNLVEEMTDKRISPTYVTLAIVINTLTEIDYGKGSTLAEDYLKGLIAEHEHFDITSKYPPRTALSPDIFVPIVRQALKVGSRSEAFIDAQKIYELYAEKSASKGGQHTKPNIYLLTEMLAASCRARNLATASRWWESVLETAVEIGSEIDISADSKKWPVKRKPFINVPSKHLLCKPWSYLANLLAYDQNWLEIERTWDQVANHGFEFDIFNWNERVRYCAVSRRNIIWACKMCEEHLIEKWITLRKGRKGNHNVPGYHVWGGQNRAFQLREKTLIALKEAFRDLQIGEYAIEAGEQVDGREAMKQIEERSHRLYEEVENWEGYDLVN